MKVDLFKEYAIKLNNEFGAENFSKAKLDLIWAAFWDLPDKEATSIFVWALGHFKKLAPPNHQQIINEAIRIKNNTKALNSPAEAQKAIINSEFYENLLQKFGTTSIAEAISLGKHKKAT